MMEFVTNRKLYWGKDSLLEVEQLLKWYGKRNILLVVYSKDAPSIPCITKQITAIEGASYTIYDGIKGEPDLETIDAGVKLFNDNNCDCVIGLGGGSVLDASKAIAFISQNGGVAEDYQMGGKVATKETALFIAVPTTAGTGSEATKVSVLTNNEVQIKKAFYHTSMIAEVAILDPSLTAQLPKKIMASTGIDALTHAIESYVSKNANAISKMYSLEAIRIIAKNLASAVNENDEEARSNMLLGSYFAGFGISASIGYAHFFSMSLGSTYHVPHGDSCSIFLVASMEFNLDYALDEYVEIAKALGVSDYNKTKHEIAKEGIELVRSLRDSVDAPTMLTDFIPRDKINIEALIENVDRSTGHLKCNPRPVEPTVLREILATVM